MTKRLCDLVDLTENSRDCVVLTVKEGVVPLDLVRLGGFGGNETMFRLSKDPRTVRITISRDGEMPFTMNYGSSTTRVLGDMESVRNQIMECVNLDFGIVTGGMPVRAGESYEHLVDMTSGERDLDSPRHFEMIRANSGFTSLFVNGQSAELLDWGDLPDWLASKNTSMTISSEKKSGRDVTIIKGEFKRCPVHMSRDQAVSPEAPIEKIIDGALQTFLMKKGWQNLSATDAVKEFARFMKVAAEPSLDDLMGKAKEKATEKNLEHQTSRSAKSRTHSEKDR